MSKTRTSSTSSNNNEKEAGSIVMLTGLTSEKGLKLNGSVGTAFLTKNDVNSNNNLSWSARDNVDPDQQQQQQQQRVPVYIDGHGGPPLSIKRSNLVVFPMTCGTRERYSVGAGRPTFRTKQVQGMVVNDDTEKPISRVLLNDGPLRSRANLEALDQFFRQFIQHLAPTTMHTQPQPQPQPHTKDSLKKANGQVEEHLGLAAMEPQRNISISVTDLNVARALARIASGGDAALASPLDHTIKSIAKTIREITQTTITTTITNAANNYDGSNTDPTTTNNRNNNHNNNNPAPSPRATIWFKYFPHRLSPDEHTLRLGQDRVSSVKAGSYRIYPCPHEQFFDALEVLYANPHVVAVVDDEDDHHHDHDKTTTTTPTTTTKPSKEITIHQDIYLDYGMEEAKAYARHAKALDEVDRLSPHVLAQVDPQAFWSAVLHLDIFVTTLTELKLFHIQKEWEPLIRGCHKSHSVWKTHCGPLCKAVQVSEKEQDLWNISTDKDHKKQSRLYAVSALATVMDSIHAALKERNNNDNDDGIDDNGDVDDAGGNNNKIVPTIRVETQDHYQGTVIGRVFEAVMLTMQMERDHLQKGGEKKGTVTRRRKMHFLNEALEREGFGKDALQIKNPPSTCGYCDNKNKSTLRECGGCGGAAYCSKDCQIRAWKEHKRECDPVLAEFRKTVRRLNARGGTQIDCKKRAPRSALPAKITAFSETSGMGYTGIVWNPAGGSALTSLDEPFDSEAAKNNPSAYLGDSTIKFDTVAELPAIFRVLLSCGPLPDIEMAQQSLDEALVTCQGNLQYLRINGACFTALEWAAKKGNREIVEWLCKDRRTRALVSIGSPVGWACYTGQVDIARILVAHGANASSTDPVLWESLPPLLVAAQNGELSSLKYLVEELGHDIAMKDESGQGVIQHIKLSPNWKNSKGHCACRKWAKKKLKSK